MNDIAKEINKHVERLWPADKFGRMGRLYYIGEMPYPDGSWMQYGITPVDNSGAVFVLGIFGVNVDPIQRMIVHEMAHHQEQYEKASALRASAAAKLTPEEREACNL